MSAEACADANLESLKAQIEEIEALQCMYPDEVILEPDEVAAIEDARSICGGGNGAGWQHPALSCALQLPSAQVGGRPVTLRLSLPPDYPATSPPSTRLRVEGAGRDLAEALADAAGCALSRCWVPGAGCLLGLVEEVGEEVARRGEELDKLAGEGGGREVVDGERVREEECRNGADWALGRRLIWFHHIKNPGKRRHIVAWARELRLGGFCKPGFPGIIVVEGDEGDCREFVARVRALPWQAMQVRVEELHTAASVDAREAMRCLPIAFEELAEGGMGALAEACGAAGLGEMVLAALKLAPESAGLTRRGGRG